MTSSLAIAVLVSVLLVAEADLSSSEIKTIVGVANFFRSRHVQVQGANGNGAGNMQAVQWSSELADSARNAAMKCPEDHTPGLHWGENIAFATPSGTLNFVELFRFWFEKEGASYDLIQNKCLKNQECGHWRQLMWASVRNMGCALNRCENLLVLNTYPGDILICHFDHAPIRSDRPFKSGAPCSACPSGNSCVQNLCLAPGQNLVFESVGPANSSAAASNAK